MLQKFIKIYSQKVQWSMAQPNDTILPLWMFLSIQNKSFNSSVSNPGSKTINLRPIIIHKKNILMR